MKQAIIKLLESGSIIKVDYKKRIEDWFSEISIYMHKDMIMIGPEHMKFYDVDDGINYFMDKAYTSKNKGFIQRRLGIKGLIDEENEYDFETPSKKMRKIFKDEGIIIDKEFEDYGVVVKKFPKLSEAKKDFKKIKDMETLEEIKEYLTKLKKKYSVLDLVFYGYDDYEFINDRGDKDTGSSSMELIYFSQGHLDQLRDYSRYNSDFYKNMKSTGFSIHLIDGNNYDDRTEIKIKI